MQAYSSQCASAMKVTNVTGVMKRYLFTENKYILQGIHAILYVSKIMGKAAPTEISKALQACALQ